MKRKIKGLGLAFVAIAAMSMVAAGAAQATQLHVTDAGPAVIFGEQEGQHVFTTDSGQVKCTQGLFESGKLTQVGGQQITTDHLTVTGTYTGCTAFGLAATVDMNGCKYTIQGTDTTSPQPKTFTGQTVTVGISGCTSGKQIEITTATCTVTVPETPHYAHIIFTHIAGPPEHVQAHITVTGIKYEGHGACPSLPATTLTSNGTYQGTATFKARKENGSTEPTHNGHKYQKFNQTGALVGLLVT